MTTKKIPTTSSPLANIAHNTGKTAPVPTTISAPTTNSDTVYVGAPGQIAPIAEAPVVDEMTGLSDTPSVPATIFKYTYFGSTDEVVVDQTTYQDNSALALVMLNAYNKQLVTVISINMPEVPLGKDEIIVKDYSENAGMAQWLEDNKIAIYTATSVMMPHGNVCPIMKLL